MPPGVGASRGGDRRLLDDPPLRERLGANAREAVAPYSHEAAADASGERRSWPWRDRAGRPPSPGGDPASGFAGRLSLAGLTAAPTNILPPMKAVILAGGTGTRISEESVVRPKP